MNGPDHYRKAEELLADLTGLPRDVMTVESASIVAEAQVHAILALAAATALGTSGTEAQAWTDAAGTELGGRGS